MNNSIVGYSFSSNYSNINGNINTSHQITKMNNDNIITEKYRNNRLVKILKSPSKNKITSKKFLSIKGPKKLKGINLGTIIKSKLTTPIRKASLKLKKKSPKKTTASSRKTLKKSPKKPTTSIRKNSLKIKKNPNKSRQKKRN